jgi:type II secretory pathway predicted ATPase ExeA
MHPKKLHSLYGLKWNPFLPELPHEALVLHPKINHFAWKVENLIMDGGFALITGDPGLGKSVALRLLSERFNQVGDFSGMEFTRPQSGLADFYRELGQLFGVDLKMNNKYGGFQKLREKWKDHLNKNLFRPVLLIDEAQEVHPSVLSELRLLSSTSFDSKIILTIVLGGDSRLVEKLQCPDLLPINSRIRTRLILENYTNEESIILLTEALDRAGNPSLMTKGLIETMAEHSCGNPRAMMIACGDLLMEASSRDLQQMNEDLYIKLNSGNIPDKKRKNKHKDI